MAKPVEKKFSAPMMRGLASVEPKSFNKEKRTFEIVFTRGARVRRSSWFDGPYYEELGLEKENVRMGRLNSGAPFLDTHGYGDKGGVRGVLGVIEGAELIPGKEGRATVRFSQRAEVADIMQDVADGILRNVSVGYAIHRFQKVEEIEGVPVYRAMDWEPIEVSLVPSGADDGAKVRSEETEKFDCLLVGAREVEPVSVEPSKKVVAENPDLNETDKTRGQEMTEAEKKALEDKVTAEATAQAKKAEKERANEIRSMVKKAQLDEALAQKLIDEDKSIDECRVLVIDAIAAKANTPETQTRTPSIEVGKDNARAHRVEGMADALLHRFRPQTSWLREHGASIKVKGFEMTDKARAFNYMSLLDMARVCLEANGVRTQGMSKEQVADAALKLRSLHTTSDFPEILANVANKTLRAGYESAPTTWKPFTREVTAPDFKEISRVNLGDAPKPAKVGEHGEVTRGTMSEAAEKYRVEEYAKVVGITRKVIINDDLGAFTQVPERLGRRVADLDSDLVWGVVKANAAMADGFNLFSTQHGNLSGTPAAPSEAGLNEARAAMRRQLGLDGAELALVPRWLYVPPAHETAAEKLVASIMPQSSGNVNPFSASGRTPLLLGVEPRLESAPSGSLTAWFVFGDIGQVDMVELARLEGRDGPALESREGFDIAGLELKISYDVGVKAIDHRGMFKNAGA